MRKREIDEEAGKGRQTEKLRSRKIDRVRERRRENMRVRAEEKEEEKERGLYDKPIVCTCVFYTGNKVLFH